VQLDVLFTPGELGETDLSGRAVVVVDVLRTSTTITTALENGADAVIPASGPDVASQLAARIGRKDVLLCGERGARIIEGFDLGNSPSEYTPDTVSGRTLIFASTNGSPLIVRSESAALTAVCAFVNLNATTEVVKASGIEHIMVVGSGKEGRFALEDAVCAGVLVKLLNNTSELSDGAKAAASLAAAHGERPLALLQQCDHGRYLASIGYASDLRFCARVDAFESVPIVRDGRLVAAS
jgi:2-phosphosulfolactate phosphatase